MKRPPAVSSKALEPYLSLFKQNPNTMGEEAVGSVDHECLVCGFD